MRVKIDYPVLNVKLVPLKKVEANDYNPNKVARPELQLLKLSILQDGYTQPIVCYYNEEEDKYLIVWLLQFGIIEQEEHIKFAI